MAITDNVALYALGYWVSERHPVRLDEFCLNVKQRKHTCTVCTEVCPRDINVHEKQPRWLRCTNCNLCVNACPTQALHESSTSFNNIYSLLNAEEDTVVLACERYEGVVDLRLSCLSSVPWEMLATLALRKRLVLKASPCKTCDQQECLDAFKETVRQLKFFFGKEEFKKRVLSQTPADLKRLSGFSKRKAIESAAGVVKKGVENLVEEHEGSLSHYRALLIDALQDLPESKRPLVHWRTLIEDGNCSGCGICAKMCPHHAIKLHIPGSRDYDKLREEGEDDKPMRLRGKATRTELAHTGVSEETPVFIHEASRCTNCGLCYLNCTQEAIGDWDTLATKNLPAIQATELDVRICEKCKRTFRPKEPGDTRCAACARFVRK